MVECTLQQERLLVWVALERLKLLVARTAPPPVVESVALEFEQLPAVGQVLAREQVVLVLG